MIRNTINLLGYASGLGGAVAGSSQGAPAMQQSSYLTKLADAGVHLHWQTMLTPELNGETKLNVITQTCQQLAKEVSDLVAKKQFFTVIGGDHSCAIGTWSGAHAAVQDQGPLGLIWFDAHMDSHTPKTSETGNIHGMPFACLLGHGEHSLTHILAAAPQLKPEHVCLIGVRSYESGEAEFLKQLNVRIFFMDEVKKRGLPVILQEALAIATNGTAAFGVSLDLDSIDPQDAPGTGVAEPDGIKAAELCQALQIFAGQEKLLGIEIVEFDPKRDKNQLTEKLIVELMSAMVLGKSLK